VDLPKLKIHGVELLTCAVKNLGIGLFPTEANASQEPGKFRWKYGIPDLRIATGKARVPHFRWAIKCNPDSGTPTRDGDGNYVWTRTGGLEATMADCIQAVRGQGVMMLHVVDAIEATNISHAGPGCTTVPEGLVFASNDIVGVDACCSRYLFSTVAMADLQNIRREHRLASDVVQKVPMPRIEGPNVVAGTGYDSPFSRYGALKHCEDRGLGQREFHVVGKDLWQGGNLGSLGQHLGRVDNGVFDELLTTTLYHTPGKVLWDLQATSLAYIEANDELTGSDFKKKILEAYDENEDGVIDYMERGRGVAPQWMAYESALTGKNADPLDMLKLRFLMATSQLRLLKKEWNHEGHNLGEHPIVVQAL